MLAFANSLDRHVAIAWTLTEVEHYLVGGLLAQMQCTFECHDISGAQQRTMCSVGIRLRTDQQLLQMRLQPVSPCLALTVADMGSCSCQDRMQLQ